MENQGKTRGKKQSVSFSFEFGEIFTLSNLWISAWRLFSGIRDSFVDSRRQRFDFALTCWHFFKLHALATKPQMFNSTLNQLAMNTTLL